MLIYDSEGADSGEAPTAQAQLQEIATALAGVPKQTQAGSGIPGDPLNFAFVGTAEQLSDSLTARGWLTSHQGPKSDLEYGVDTVLHKVDRDAPVSDLFLLGRKQDMAFEQAESTSRRHHLRLWQVGTTQDGRTLWVGAATHDIGVIVKPNYLTAFEQGVEHKRFSIGLLLPTTHQIDAKVDDERDKVVADLAAADNTILGSIPGFGQTHGADGDGVAFTTDGQMTVIVAGNRNPSAPAGR